MDDFEKRTLINVARMYYENEMTQGEISKKLGIHRTSVGRLLKKAREEGIVIIEIPEVYNHLIELEQKITEKFKLKEVIVISSTNESEEDTKIELGKTAQKFLNRIIKDDDVIGLGWGGTIGKIIYNLPKLGNYDVDFVPLVGGSGKMKITHHINTMVSTLAESFGGTPHFIDAEALYKTKEIRDAVMNSDQLIEISQFWKRLDIALFGIGSPNSSANMVWSGFFGDKEIQKLENLNAVGDIYARYFDINGHLVDSDIVDRTVAVELEKLKTLKYSIGIAATVEKTEAIVGALNGNYLNTLITDECTAESILKYVN